MFNILHLQSCLYLKIILEKLLFASVKLPQLVSQL